MPTSGVVNTAVGTFVCTTVGRLARTPVGEGVAFADGDRRQLPPVRDVADGVDRSNVRCVRCVDLDGAEALELYARVLKPKPPRVGPPAGRDHDLIDVESLPR